MYMPRTPLRKGRPKIPLSLSMASGIHDLTHVLYKIYKSISCAKGESVGTGSNSSYLPDDTGLWLSGDKKRTSFGADSLELSDMELERRDLSPVII